MSNRNSDNDLVLYSWRYCKNLVQTEVGNLEFYHRYSNSNAREFYYYHINFITFSSKKKLVKMQKVWYKKLVKSNDINDL